MTDPNLTSAFARLEGVVTTEIKHLSANVAEINKKLDAYPTHRDLQSVADRVTSLEDSRSWIIKSVMWAWICGSGVAITGAIALYKLLT